MEVQVSPGHRGGVMRPHRQTDMQLRVKRRVINIGSPTLTDRQAGQASRRAVNASRWTGK